ncbi:thiamine phosphate synthase [Chromatium weissei]|nr:thiamine phosphate synthase [Chromatium weissei]
MTASLAGLYAITSDTAPSVAALVAQVAAAIDGGARLIQYRDKRASSVERHARAAALLALCRAANIPLMINDDVALALAIGADGVHLGRDDANVHSARARLGDAAIIGVSCYDAFALAKTAAAAGANYVAFGSFFASATKPHAVRADPALLTAARRELAVPCVAIGGITPQNGRALIAAGAHMLAVITGVFDQPDIAAAARSYSNLFIKELI